MYFANCVISLEDLNFKLKIPIKRYLSSNLNPQYEIINYENINCDTDPLTENIDLGDIVSEEIYLALPKYPKKSGVKLKNILITEETSELNPFKILENLSLNFIIVVIKNIINLRNLGLKIICLFSTD